jgi:uncharacterized protein (DUF1330 family)
MFLARRCDTAIPVLEKICESPYAQIFASGNGSRRLAWFDEAMSKAYVIADIDVTDPDAYEDYKRLSSVAAEKYGARFLVRGGAVDVLEGTWTPTRLVVLEFDDADAARRWYDSPEYAEAKAVRHRAADSAMLVVGGA